MYVYSVNKNLSYNRCIYSYSAGSVVYNNAFTYENITCYL
jgi:hypothetical protein